MRIAKNLRNARSSERRGFGHRRPGPPPSKRAPSARRGRGKMTDWPTLADLLGHYLFPGVVTGCIYALGAIGVSLLFGILRFAHFAHGDVMTLGAYLALTVVWWLGWPALAAIPFAAAGTAIVAVALDRAFYRPFRRRPTIISVIASFGVMLMVRSAVQLVWGVQPLQYKAGIERPLILFGGLRVQERHMWIVGVTAVLVLALHLMLTRTRIGRAMRAVSDEPDLARVTGISTERVILVTWLIGGALAAVAGIFLGMDTKLASYMGWDQLLPIFA